MKKAVVLSVVVVLTLVVLAACSSAKGSDFPTGMFVSTSNPNNEVQYNQDNTWAYYMGGLMSAKGSYKVDKNLWIEQGTDECPFTGTYQWTFDGKTLSFKLQGEDQCEPRRLATDGQSFQLKN